MQTIRKYITQQYPREENPWKIILPVSAFIGLFMLVFQPFGLDDLEMQFKGLFLAGFGILTFLVLIIDMVLFPVLIPRLFKDEKWTVIKEIVSMLWILFTLGLANLVYTYLVLDFSLSLSNALAFQSFTIIVGLLPVTVITIIKQNYLKRKNESRAEQITNALLPHKIVEAPAQVVQFLGENQKEELKVDAENILFIKSEGNYITIGYLKNGRFAQGLLRNTMKYATDRVAGYPFLYQCHRSWVVNLHRITRVGGNSQGLKIFLKDFEESIPVARKNTTGFREKITGIKD
jgi:DNA-binding LytR/AlgR family response regulator